MLFINRLNRGRIINFWHGIDFKIFESALSDFSTTMTTATTAAATPTATTTNTTTATTTKTPIAT